MSKKMIYLGRTSGYIPYDLLKITDWFYCGEPVREPCFVLNIEQHQQVKLVTYLATKSHETFCQSTE